MGVAYDEINPSGSRTMILVGGGDISYGGIELIPLAQQGNDYQEFVQTSTKNGWRIIAIHGQDYPESYDILIDALAKQINDSLKPILVGHSAGAVVGLDYVKDCPQDSWFDRVLLFNCPLIYPDQNTPTSLQTCYQGTETVTADVTLTMSKNDPIMTYTLQDSSMMQAVNVIREAGKVKIQIIDQHDY